MRSCPTYGGRFHCLPSLADPNRHCAGLSRYFFHAENVNSDLAFLRARAWVNFAFLGALCYAT
jgi:hypothetical protein